MNKTQYKNAFKALIEKQGKCPVELKYGDDGFQFTVNVNPIIPFKKRCEMIKFIVDSVFTSGINTIQSYTPEYEEFARRCAVIDYYTDLKLPDKLDDVWLLLNQTTIYFDVVEAVGREEIGLVFEEARKGIDARKQYLANKTDINALFEKIGNMVSNVGNDFSKEDLNSILDVFKNMPNLSEDQIVSGILKAREEKSTDKE